MTAVRATPQDLVEAGLAQAGLTQAGLAQAGCAILVEETWQVNLRWALSGLTTNGLASSRSVTAIVALPVAGGPGGTGGTGVGVLTRPASDVQAVRRLVDDAGRVARTGAPAEDAGPFVGGGVEPGWDSPALETGPATLAPTAQALGDVFAAGRAGGREAFGFARHEVATTWLGTSGGLRYRAEQPTGTIELNAKSHDRSRSAWAGRSTRDFADVDVHALDAELATRLGWQANRLDLPAGRYDTVLPPSAVADLLIYLYWSADARSAAEGRSVFSVAGGGTRLGDRLSAMPLTLGSDPADPELACPDRVLATSSSPLGSVFDNGLPAPARNWIDAGVVAALPGTRHTERTTGVPLTSALDNLTLSAPGAAGTDLDLVAGLDRGLLLTCLWYIREVDPRTLLVTGLTRDGVYVVEGGEVVGATTNFRFNESPVDLLGRVTAVGRGQVALPREWGDWFTRTRMPALAVRGMNMSSVSEAS